MLLCFTWYVTLSYLQSMYLGYFVLQSRVDCSVPRNELHTLKLR